VRELNDYETSAAFSPLEKLVLRYADRMTETPVDVGDDSSPCCASIWMSPSWSSSPPPSRTKTCARAMNHALGYGAAGFSNGAACALPAQRTLPEQESHTLQRVS
jgi:hypothetical protein